MLRALRAGSGAAVGFLFLFAAVVAPIASRAEGNLYQLVGKLHQEDGRAFRGIVPVVYLSSNAAPFLAQALVDPAGHFKIKDVPAGPYTVSISVPRGGELTQTVEIGPSFADRKRRVLKDFLFRRKPAPSTAHLVSTVELSVPDSARAEYQRAQVCLGRHDVEGAIARLQKAVELAPQFAAALNNLGTIAFQSKRLMDAEGYFREALRQDPGFYLALVNLAGTVLSSGRPDEALPLNQAAVRTRPEDPLAQSQLGQNYFQLGQLETAERHLKLASSLDASHFTYPQLVLADIYQRRQDFPALTRELEDFLRLHPDSKKVQDVRKLLRYARARSAARAGR